MKCDKKGNIKSKISFGKDEKLQNVIVYIYQFDKGIYVPSITGNKQ